MHALLVALLLLAAPPAGRPAVTLKVSPPARLTVGDHFPVTLEVTTANPSLVMGPLADSAGVFAVARERRSTKLHGATMTTTWRLDMAGFAPGRHVIPAFVFLVRTGARLDTLRSDTASVTIASVLPATMKDINPLAPPETFPNLLLWILPLALLALAALAWLAWRLRRRLLRLQELTRAPLPPWEEALAALDRLPWKEWIEGGQFKRCYYSLSEVLKRYIERRFEFAAAEQTTTEMLASMRAHRTPMREEVARFFSRSDLVKYAKTVPSPEEAEAAVEEVRAFVLRTKPAERAPAAAPAPAPAAAAAGGSA